MDSRFYQAQQSSQLRGLIQEIRELTDLSVQIDADDKNPPKYELGTIHSLAAVVLFRSHGKQMRSLCVLLVAAIQADRGKGYANFLWTAGAGRRDRCASYFLQSLPGERRIGETTATASTAGISLHFAEPETGALSVGYEFVPLLACLLDFLVRSLGTQALDEPRKLLSRRDLARSDLEDIANSLTRELYAWLDPHVPAKHRQNMFRVIGDFFAAQLGDGFTVDQIGDGNILDLWRHLTSPNPEISISKAPKKFTPVYLECLRFMELVSESIDLERFERSLAIVTGDEAITGSGLISADRLPNVSSLPTVANEDAAVSDLRLDPGAMAVEYGQVAAGDAAAPLQLLATAPVNVINDGHVRRLDIICHWPDWIEHLPLSYLRSEAFGSIAKINGAAWRRLFENNMYQNTSEELTKAARQVEDGLAACYYLRMRDKAGTDPSAPSDFALAKGQSVLERSRHGFQDALRGDPGAVGAFSAIEAPLLMAKTCLDRVRNVMVPPLLDSEVYESDRTAFTQHYTSISGDRS